MFTDHLFCSKHCALRVKDEGCHVQLSGTAVQTGDRARNQWCDVVGGGGMGNGHPGGDPEDGLQSTRQRRGQSAQGKAPGRESTAVPYLHTSRAPRLPANIPACRDWCDGQGGALPPRAPFKGPGPRTHPPSLASRGTAPPVPEAPLTAAAPPPSAGSSV